MRPVLILGIFCSDGPIQRALLYKWSRVRWQMRDSENWATDGVSVAIGPSYCLLHNHDSNEFVCAEGPAYIGDIFFL